MRNLAIFVFLGFMFVPTQTNAVCAWILWTKGIFSYKGNDKPLEMKWEPTAFDTHKQCEAARTTWLTRTPKAGETIEQMGNDIIAIKSEGMTSILSAKCLPDTMDPNR